MLFDTLSKSYKSTAAYPGELETVELSEGMTVAYVDMGLPKTGRPALIFVHGLSSFIPVWSRNLDALSEHYRCIALDLPGYGQSSPGPYLGTMVFYSDVLVEFMAALGITSAILVGHSMGGQISLITALRYPYRVDKLILVAPAGLEVFSAQQQQVMKRQFGNFPLMSILMLRLYNRTLGRRQMDVGPGFAIGDVIQQNPSPTYSQTLANSIKGMIQEPVFDYLGQVYQPTLIIFGDNDKLIPNPIWHHGETKDIAEAAVAKLPDAQLLIINQSGHFLQYEQPQLFNKALVDFIG